GGIPEESSLGVEFVRAEGAQRPGQGQDRGKEVRSHVGRPIVVAIRPSMQPGRGPGRFGIRARPLPTTSGFPYAGIEPGLSCRRRSRMKRIVIGALVI